MRADVWNSLSGYVMIQIEGAALERLINRALHSGIQLWNIRRASPTAVTAYVSVAGFYALRRLRRGTRCRIRIEEKHGALIALSRMRHRKVLLYGWIAALSVLLMLSRFVWFIDVQGCARIPKDEIYQTLIALGVQPGVRRGSVPAGDLGREIMASDARIAWAGAQLEGVVLTVEIWEAVPAAQVRQDAQPCSVYAAKDGVIRSIIAYSGHPKVTAGDAVLAGALLIDGSLGNELFVEARGEVMAEVLYRFSAAAGPELSMLAQSGNRCESRQLYLKERELLPAESRFALFERNVVSSRSIERFFLPLRLETSQDAELIPSRGVAGVEELRRAALERAERALLAGLPEDAQLLSKRTEYTVEDNGAVAAVIHVTVRENIAKIGALE